MDKAMTHSQEQRCAHCGIKFKKYLGADSLCSNGDFHKWVVPPSPPVEKPSLNSYKGTFPDGEVEPVPPVEKFDDAQTLAAYWLMADSENRRKMWESDLKKICEALLTFSAPAASRGADKWEKLWNKLKVVAKDNVWGAAIGEDIVDYMEVLEAEPRDL